MSVESHVVSNDRSQVGEGAWWDAGRNVLWSVDIWAQTLCRTDPRTGTTERITMPEMIGGVAVMANGELVLALQTGLFLYNPECAAPPRFLSAPDDLLPTHRFNDVTVDPCGRFVSGTIKMSQAGSPEPSGKLYSYDGNFWRTLCDGLWTVNGLAFSPAGDIFYWSDSFPEVNNIWSSPYDPLKGEIGAANLFVDMRQHRGRPDGAAMDSEGGYWIAAIGAGCVHRFFRDGQLDRTIELPVEYPTRPAFGGTGLETLFVTSLSIRPSVERPDLAGAIIAVRPGISGHPLPAVVFS